MEQFNVGDKVLAPHPNGDGLKPGTVQGFLGSSFPADLNIQFDPYAQYAFTTGVVPQNMVVRQ